MAAPIEIVFKKTRTKSSEELSEFYDNLFHTLNSAQTDRDRIECFFQLRKLWLYIACTKYRRKLPQELVDKLKCILMEKNHSPSAGVRGHILSSAILQEYAPTEQIVIDNFNPPTDLKRVPYILPLLIGQGPVLGNAGRLVPQMVRWVSTVGFDSDIQAAALGSLVTVATSDRSLLSREQIYVVSSQISDWLTQASLLQAPIPNRVKPKKPEQVTEIDGSPCQDAVFTLLNLSQYYSPDQLLNIHSFSCLRSWLSGTHLAEAGTPAPGGPTGAALTASGDSSASQGSFTAKSRQVLVEKACEYCLRIVDQCERKPLKFQDQDLIKACLIEAMSLLDILCSLDTSLVAKIFPAIKGVYSRLGTDLNQPRVLISLLQFFLRHSETVVFDPAPAFDHFFGQVIAKWYSDPAVAFEVITFCRDNLLKLCMETDLLEKYFPNLLKIFAWNPCTFLPEFLDILPSMISSVTATEMLHTLLDLPCEVIALEVSQQARRLGTSLSADSFLIPETNPRLPPTIEAYRNPEHKPWFNFILRNESGQGDTISKLGFLHKLLSDAASYPRSVPLSQAVPVLLRLYFRTVLDCASSTLLKQLVPVILERAGLLFDIAAFSEEIRTVFSEELLALFKHCPSLIMDLKIELLDFIGAVRNVDGKEDFFTHVVWIAGEYMSTIYDSRCNTEAVIQFYEAIETFLYEVSALIQSSSTGHIPYSARLIAVCMTALAKLASRCQDLIPRVLLCLTKIPQQQMKSLLEDEHKAALMSRANELINILKLPDVASAILSPTSDIQDGHWHLDVNTSTPLLLQATYQIVQHVSSA